MAAGIAGLIAKDAGCELVDVEYVKEGPNKYLRVYIDKEGGVSIDDCENVSRSLEKQLDEKQSRFKSLSEEAGIGDEDRERIRTEISRKNFFGRLWKLHGRFVVQHDIRWRKLHLFFLL